MNVSFEKPSATPVVEAEVVAKVDLAPAAVVPTATALVPAPPAAVSAPSAVQFDDENIGFEEVILPRINIVQKVGDLSNIFTPGEIVLNQALVIYQPAKVVDGVVKEPGSGPLNLTVLGFRRIQYAEKVVGGERGTLVNSEAEIEKAGGTLDYKTWDESVKASKVPGSTTPAKKYFQPLRTAFILIEKPVAVEDPDHNLFTYEFQGRYFALALWSMKGTSYTNGAKQIFTAKKLGYLRNGYTSTGVSCSTKLEKYGENFAWIPVLKAGVKNDEAFRDWCRTEVLGVGH